MNSTKIEPKYISKSNPRVGLIALASDFMIERDFINVIKDREIRNSLDWIFQHFHILTKKDVKAKMTPFQFYDYHYQNVSHPIYRVFVLKRFGFSLMQKWILFEMYVRSLLIYPFNPLNLSNLTNSITQLSKFFMFDCNLSFINIV